MVAFAASASEPSEGLGWNCPPCEVLLVVPPFATAKYPMLGPSLLAAACRRSGIECRILYGNLWLAARLGLDLYEEIADSSVRQMRGERPFASLAFARAPSQGRDEVPEPLARAMVKEMTAQVLRSGARIIGFSSVFQQNLASIAMARSLKAADARLVTVLGGGNADVPMGPELARVAGCFDHVFSGESEAHFPEFCRRLLQGEHSAETFIRCSPVQDLDSVPLPDYEDYFFCLRAYQERGLLPTSLPVSLPFESSRGCWWGEKQHCSFCGLNGTTMAFRRKSRDRIVSEVLDLAGRYGIRRLHATDNIMPSNFRESVLPELAKADPLTLFYEVKSNLRPQDLDLFVRAGVASIQPGIESLSGAILKRIRKGVSAAQNIWLLRECAARQIDVSWNMLVSVPGDRACDYESVLEILPLLQHLQAPSGCTPILIDRYSPYHSEPAGFEIRDLQPLRVYSEIYPAGSDLTQLAYHFTGSYPSEYMGDLAARFQERVTHWVETWNAPAGPRPALALVRLDSGQLLAFDSRDVAVEHQHLLSEAEAEVVRHYEMPRRGGSLEGQLRKAEEGLLERGFLLSHEGSTLSLLVEPEKGFHLRARSGR